jgi:STE24 endopeptidase
MAVGFRVRQRTEENGQPVPEKHNRAKVYNHTKLTLGLLGALLSFVFALTVVVSGFSRTLSSFATSITSNGYGALLVFAALFGFLEMLVGFPFALYSGFYLEHKYDLSNQTFGRWLWERTKGLLVGIPILLPLLLFFYYCLKEFGNSWWLPVGMMMFVFSTLLARVAPKLIFPLFYKFKPIERKDLRDRLMRLCAEAKFKVEGIFSFNLSKNTKKANAAFAGIGKSKRVILGDTLLEKFSDEEIEAVLAHELGHYHHGHIWKGIVIGATSTFVGLFLTARLYTASLPLFGFERVEDFAALPLLGIWLGLFGLISSPIVNLISRKHEYEADEYAVRKSGSPSAFVSALRKLAEMNLADTAPNPVIEFLFYSHPSIEKRIRFAEKEIGQYAVVAA